jgi:hypothetical protein
MWVDCPGVPWQEMQLVVVRILSGDIAQSTKGKAQKTYVALLFAGDGGHQKWWYGPMQMCTPVETSFLFGADGPFNGYSQSACRHAAEQALR